MLVRKLSYFFVLGILMLGCSTHSTEDYDKYLGGYWEIKEVTTHDGIKKSYNYNPTVDYIEIKNSTGVRKKMQPRLNGTFITSKDQENFIIQYRNDSLILHYRTSLDEWKENILSVDDTELIIKNENGSLYTYKRYEKINING